MEIDLKQLRELMRSLKQFDVSELEIEKDGERIYLRRGADTVVAPSAVIAAPAAPVSSLPPALPVAAAPGASAAAAASASSDPNVVAITSPFVGTFYRSPSPDAAPFVDVGTEIRPGQVLCIVEAMKLMNEIESEISGTIVEVLGDNGKPVEYGDALFKVRKSG
ncbi:acetyl-CoA carboxylase biotin carboxyl carrier protein [Sandaracinus amylolyticus]|uniref:Biotin carboxyl carrier protein of acetyl-CoA carboxylase n=1 Tax=Sandaracinus amylolyticus TaxID=927083 RepID=A0A0F6YHY0_9BACT|nr:acetyl-CoA carboxylase biotin carboxyl carrier protein [Sandaracinus amylolyticus]AKF06163.1 Biotin carboxyl carrier protein of acetyl-CoA carboxylase [Sandaracinus amylolyticus]